MGNTYRLLKVLAGKDKHLRQINVELCSYCNLRCRYCALDHTREKSNLDPKWFAKLCDNIIKQDYQVNRIVLSHSGEVLQHPRFKHFLATINHYKNFGGTGRFYLDTNLMLMNPEQASDILYYNALDIIICSIDGYDPQSFERLRPPAKWDIILKNFTELFELRNQLNKKPYPEIWINNGNIEGNFDYSSEFLEIFSMADQVVNYQFHDWGGQIYPPIGYDKKYDPFYTAPKGFCKFAFGIVVLLSDGTITKCCYDLNGKTAYGDLKNHTLHEILTSKRRKSDLFKMRFNKRDSIEGCSGCLVE